MEFDPIQDIIANSTTFFISCVLPATSPSSFVFPTPKFRDKELHPYSFFVIPLSVYSFVFSGLTFWYGKRPDRHTTKLFITTFAQIPLQILSFLCILTFYQGL